MVAKTAGTVFLGFEVGTGTLVEIPVRHMVVTGQSQEAGKTTTLEALTARLHDTASLAFITKRGEGAFMDAHEIPPYFRERTDWRFVQAVLEASLGQAMKFEQSWIMRASKGTKTLAGVQKNVQNLGASAKGLSEDVYYRLNEYLDIVVPALASIEFSTAVRLAPKLNVVRMDSPDFPAEVHGLVIAAMMEYIYRFSASTVTIVPEAWEFIPQGKNSPVKDTAAALIRKGAGLHNFVWLDSQDTAGVDKVLLRQCPVWLMGVQREANEIKRTLANIPAGIAKPSAAEVATLEKGQFFACWGKNVVKTYVSPKWMPRETACAIAMGRMGTIEIDARKTFDNSPPLTNPLFSGQPVRWSSDIPKDKPSPKETPMPAEKKEMSAAELLAAMARLVGPVETPMVNERQADDAHAQFVQNASGARKIAVQEDLYQAIKNRLIADVPAILRIIGEANEIEITNTKRVVELDFGTLRGRVAMLIAEGMFDSVTSANVAYNALRRVNFACSKPNVYKECDALTRLGFLTKEAGGYQVIAGMKKKIKEK